MNSPILLPLLNHKEADNSEALLKMNSVMMKGCNKQINEMMALSACKQLIPDANIAPNSC